MATEAGPSKRYRSDEVGSNEIDNKYLKLESQKNSYKLDIDSSQKTELDCNSIEYHFDSDEQTCRSADSQTNDDNITLQKCNSELIQNQDDSTDTQRTEVEYNSEEYLLNSEETIVSHKNDHQFKFQNKTTGLTKDDDSSCVHSEGVVVNETASDQFEELREQTDTQISLSRQSTENYSIDNNKLDSEKVDKTGEGMLDEFPDIQATLSRQSTENYSMNTDKFDCENIDKKCQSLRDLSVSPDMKVTLSRGSTENYNMSAGKCDSQTTSKQGLLNEDKIQPLMKIASVQRDAEVIASVVGVDIETAYEKLKDNRNNPNRIDLVTNNILEDPSPNTQPGVEKEDSLPVDPVFKNDPLYRDMLVVSKVLPEKDPNEIYAFLEAHHDKLNRILVVIQELTRTESVENESLTLSGADTDLENSSKGKGVKGQKSPFQNEVDQLKDLFPDCDPNYFYTKLEEMKEKDDRVAVIAASMFENRNYPKLKDTLELSEKNKKRQHYSNLSFDVHDFLLKFPNPMEEFENETKSVSSSYKEHCLVHLKNRFSELKDGYIKRVFEKHNHHFTLTLREIQEEVPVLRAGSKKIRRRARVREIPLPEEPDEVFFHELLFTQHKPEISAHLENQRKLRAVKIKKARDNNELYECGCCFDDECLFEEMSSCADGHLFCNGCVKGSAESAIGEGKTNFPCLTGDCEYTFPLSVLQTVLSPNKFSIALKKMQEEELRKADIPDLVSCPFCSFATIMSNPDDKVLKCLNPECLKESCRLCKEPSHIPLRCSEVEKQGETSMRAFIELKMTESMFRTCPDCQKRFYKEEGCSMMTCLCGQSMCYACRKTGIQYEHFNSCPVKDHDVSRLHQMEMEKAAEEAKDEYLREHPEASDTVLKYDPFKHLDDFKKRGGTTSHTMEDSDGYDSDYD